MALLLATMLSGDFARGDHGYATAGATTTIVSVEVGATQDDPCADGVCDVMRDVLLLEGNQRGVHHSVESEMKFALAKR